MSTPTRTLARKLSEVMAAVERIPKNGRNEFHKYDYATEADIVAAIRLELAKRQVMLLPAIVSESRCSVGEKGSVLTSLTMQMEFIDGESGESIVKPWMGYGTDKEDKGGYKAMTGGEKYFLLKTFLIPTGDDPEVEEKQLKTQPSRVQRQTREQVITDAQREELRDAALAAGWPAVVVVAMLKRHGFTSSKDITVSKFAAIKKELENGVEHQQEATH